MTAQPTKRRRMVNPQSPFTQSPKIQLACTILSSGMTQSCTRRVSLSGTSSCLFGLEKNTQSVGLHMNRLNDLWAILLPGCQKRYSNRSRKYTGYICLWWWICWRSTIRNNLPVTLAWVNVERWWSWKEWRWSKLDNILSLRRSGRLGDLSTITALV